MADDQFLVMVAAIQRVCGDEVQFTVQPDDVGAAQWRATCGDHTSVAATPQAAASALLTVVTSAGS